MKYQKVAILVFAVLSLLFVTNLTAKNIDEDKTLSPYFFVKSDDPKTDQLPLKSTRADVNISGVIAEVKVTQVYKNEGKNTLEAIYIFPASTRAAVYAMKMTIGDRVIEADIKEREQARKDYEKALSEGKTASLLEQQRPNVFQMNVGNILPGDEIKVEMYYTELLVPENNIYEFSYPAVVGPRYSNVPESAAGPAVKWIKNPYLHSGEKATYTFGLDVNILSGIPISKLASPSHDIATEFTGKEKAHVTLKESKDAGDRDFVLDYSLAGGQIQSGLLLYKGKDENFFLMMMEPPERVTVKEIVKREYIFIIDVSGSMHGFPIEVTKRLMHDLLGNLKPTDYLNVLLFAGENAVLSDKSLPANKENVQKATGFIDAQHGGGGTELLPALKRALELPREKDTSRIIVVVTDGYVAVEKEAIGLIQENLGKANLFAFGIGSSVNRYLIEAMAMAGMGEPLFILNEGEAASKAARFREYISSPVLQGIKAEHKEFNTYDVVPIAIPDLFAKKPLTVFGKYKGVPSGKIVITGNTPAGKFTKEMDVTATSESPENSALRYLWARYKIMLLSDMNRAFMGDEGLKKQITDLGLKYNLMTEYTSFVAIDKIKRADGKYETVKQPLPLPQGVSDYAVGEGGYAPSPMGMGMTKMMAPSKGYASNEKIVSSFKPIVVEKVKILEGSDTKLTALEIENNLPLSLMMACIPNRTSGKVELKITIDKSGTVIEVVIVKDTLNDKKFEQCLIGSLKVHKFPKPEKSEKVVANIVMSVSF